MRPTQLRQLLILTALATSAAGGGCASMNNTEKGAVVGGVGGAAVGTAIGAATGRPGLGAAIGGLAGTAGGALVGNDIDKQERRDRDIAQAAALADAQAAGQRVGVFDVIQMTREGQDDTVIINQIRNTRSTFDLSTSDLSALKQNGVSPRVVAEMQAARATARPARVIVREPGPVVYESGPVFVRPAPVYVVGPPRPVYAGGFYYGRHWCP